MEVHPPHGALHSVKEFMVHLLAITIGLLLALGLEASVEWVHHRNLVREAKENISREIHDNRQSLAKELNVLPVEQGQLESVLGKVNDLQHGRRAQMSQGMRWASIRLSDSAWRTSASSGATAYMSYAEAKRYSRLYAVQEIYDATMERYLNSRLAMYGFLVRLSLPERPSSAEFEAGKRAITDGIVTGQALLEIGKGLNSAYETLARDR